MSTQEEIDQQVEAAMLADGVSPTTPAQVDYFGFDFTERVALPDGVSYVDIKALNEGERRKYLNDANREVKVQKRSGDAIMRLATGDERINLLERAIVGWNFVSANGKSGVLQPVAFSQQNLNRFLEAADPQIIDLIEKHVRAMNKWLVADVEVADIDAQIEELQELRANKVKEDEGKRYLIEVAEQVFANKPPIGTIPESLRLYLMCSMMKWAHLPVVGGLYDQHPDLLDQFEVISSIDAKAQKRRHDEAERKARSKSRR